MTAASACWAASSAPRSTKPLRQLAAMVMAWPLARMARSTALPLTRSARELGKRRTILGGRPTANALSNAA